MQPIPAPRGGFVLTRRSLLKALAPLLAMPPRAWAGAPGNAILVDGWVLLDTDLRELNLAA